MDSFDRMAIHGYVDISPFCEAITLRTTTTSRRPATGPACSWPVPCTSCGTTSNASSISSNCGPKYESIYDISHRFGNGRNGKPSGRSGKLSQNNVIYSTLSDLPPATMVDSGRRNPTRPAAEILSSFTPSPLVQNTACPGAMWIREAGGTTAWTPARTTCASGCCARPIWTCTIPSASVF